MLTGPLPRLVRLVCDHLACDTVQNVDLEQVATFGQAAPAVAVAIATGELAFP